MPYYTILYYTILYYTILYYAILYYTILYYTILYYTILYYTILYYTILYYTILYHTILYHTTLYYTIPYCIFYHIIDMRGSSRFSGSSQSEPGAESTRALRTTCKHLGHLVATTAIQQLRNVQNMLRGLLGQTTKPAGGDPVPFLGLGPSFPSLAPAVPSIFCQKAAVFGNPCQGTVGLLDISRTVLIPSRTKRSHRQNKSFHSAKLTWNLQGALRRGRSRRP